MEKEVKSPAKKRPLQKVTEANELHVGVTAETTEITPCGRTAAPGKVLIKVKKTRSTIDAKGYMCFEDYSSYDEVDEKKVPKKLKSQTTHQVPAQKRPAP